MIAIDLGSNTIRFIEFDCKKKEVIKDYEKIVKTADGLLQTSEISQEALDRICTAIDEASRIIDFKDQDVTAYATQALRVASNSSFIIESIKEKTNIEFKIIDAELEANLTLLAVKNRLEMLSFKTDNFVLVDVGGGSSEILFYNNGKISTKSFPLGIVTLTQESNNIKEALHVKLIEIKKFIDEYYALHVKPELFISVAGTPTTISAIKQGMEYSSYDSSKINGAILSLEDYDNAYNRLLKLDFPQRAKLVGVGREDLIISGVLVMKSFYKLLGFDKSVVIDDGLREGIALEYCLSQL